MKYVHIKDSPILKDVFLSDMDGALITYDEESNELSNDELLEHLCTSYDGELYWYPMESGEKLLSFAQEWFVNNLSKMNADLDGTLSNGLIYKKTPHGYLFVDTQLDMDSILEDMFNEFAHRYPQYKDDKTYYLSDAHLIDNLVLGRDSMTDSNETLVHLYKEQVLTDDILYNHFENIFQLDILNSEFFKGNIVLTGTFKLTREEIKEMLEDNDIIVSDKVNKNSWLWIGDKPGKSKVEAAKKLNIKTSNVEELMNLFVDNEKQSLLLEKILNAIEKDNLKSIEKVISEGFDINYSYSLALVKSIEANKDDIAEYLISQGADASQAKMHNSPSVNKWVMDKDLKEKDVGKARIKI